MRLQSRINSGKNLAVCCVPVSQHAASHLSVGATYTNAMPSRESEGEWRSHNVICTQVAHKYAGLRHRLAAACCSQTSRAPSQCTELTI